MLRARYVPLYVPHQLICGAGIGAHRRGVGVRSDARRSADEAGLPPGPGRNACIVLCMKSTAGTLHSGAAAPDAAQPARRNDGVVLLCNHTAHVPQTYLDQAALSLQSNAFVHATFAVLQAAVFMEARAATDVS